MTSVGAMSWFDQYKDYAEKKAKATAWQRRHVEKIKAATAGRQIEEAKAEEAFSPVTSELKETKQLLGEIKNSVNLQPIIDQLSTINLQPMSERLDTSLSQIVGQLSKLRYAPQTPTPSTAASIFDVEPVISILNKHNLPHPNELHNVELIRELVEKVTTASKTLGGKKHSTTGDTRKGIDAELEVLRKYKEALNEATKKQAGGPTLGYGGTAMYYKKPEELKNRLRVLFGEMRAGNVTIDIQNEAIALIDKLQDEGVFEPTDSQTLYGKVYSF